MILDQSMAVEESISRDRNLEVQFRRRENQWRVVSAGRGEMNESEMLKWRRHVKSGTLCSMHILIQQKIAHSWIGTK